MSFYTSLTGLNGAQADIAAISNNIANVGTTGFKRSRAEFGDIFATSPLQAASSAIGSGTILKSIKQQFTQGNIESSLNALDLAISGQGFFALKPSLTSTQTVYTRNGAFSVNNDRYVVDSQGQLLQVFPVNADGSVIATGIQSAQNLQLPTTSGLPKASQTIQLGLNLPADAEIIPNKSQYTSSNPYVFDKTNPATYNKSTSITIYDSLGNPTIATIYYVKTSNATETSPTNKWQTHVFVGDREVTPQLITAKDDQSKTYYINKFGQITTDPQAVDPTFNAAAPHPLFKQDDQTDKTASTAASAVGALIKTSGFDFGDTDATPVTIYTDAEHYRDTKEGGATGSNPAYWGRDMFTISVDGSEAQSISIKAGKYTGTQLAAELTRAVNEKFSGQKYFSITDTYRKEGGSVIPGNDIVQVSLSKLTEDGASVALNPPIEIDLLGTGGSAGTPQVGGYTQGDNKLTLTRQQLIDLTQQKLNDALAKRRLEFNKPSDWPDASKPPITVGYDIGARALTFTVDPTQLGGDANEPASRFNSLQVFNPTSLPNDLGLPPRSSSQDVLIRANTVWTGSATLPTGDSILDPREQRTGIKVSYNKDTRQFVFSSGSTGEASSIVVGRSQLAESASPQISAFDMSNVDFSTASSSNPVNVSLEVNGRAFNYSYTPTPLTDGVGQPTPQVSSTQGQPAPDTLTVSRTPGSAIGTTEASEVAFTSLVAGQSITVGGQTLYATGNVTAADVASAFINSTAPSNGFLKGTQTAWTAAAKSGSTTTAVFTSTTATTNVGDLTVSTAVLSGTAPAALSPSITQGSSANLVTEQAAITMPALTAGQSITIAGLTLTAIGSITPSDVATAFITGTAPTSGGFTGALTGWTAAVDNASASSVVFTSTTPNTDVQNISTAVGGSSGTAPTPPVPTTTQGTTGTTAQTEVTFKALVEGQSVTIGGKTLTATGDLTANQVAQAFFSGAAPANGTFSGSISGWTSTLKAGTQDTLVFTSNTPNSSVPDLVTTSTGRTESAVLTFPALLAGQTITVAGRTLTAAQDLTANNVAAAFANASVTGAIMSGEYTNWSPANSASGTTLQFNSTTPNSDVTDLVPDSSIPGSGSIEDFFRQVEQKMPVSFSNAQILSIGSGNTTEKETIDISGRVMNNDEYTFNIAPPTQNGTEVPFNIKITGLTSSSSTTERMTALQAALNAALRSDPANFMNGDSQIVTASILDNKLVLDYKVAGPVNSHASLKQTVRGSDPDPVTPSNPTPFAGLPPIKLTDRTVFTAKTVRTDGTASTPTTFDITLKKKDNNAPTSFRVGDVYRFTIPNANGTEEYRDVVIGKYNSASLSTPINRSNTGEEVTFTDFYQSIKKTLDSTSLEVTLPPLSNDTLTFKILPTNNVTGTISIQQTHIANASAEVVMVRPDPIGPFSLRHVIGGNNLEVEGNPNGEAFRMNVRVNGLVKTALPVGAQGSTSKKGVQIGQAVTVNFKGSNDLLGVGGTANVNYVPGTGLTSTAATAVGTTAITSMSQTFFLNESLGENKMTFTVDGIVGTISLPIRAYTGDTFATAIQDRVNQIQDPKTGRIVSGVTVKFDPDRNRLIFTSGTTGQNSQINVVGHPNFGLGKVTQTAGSVPMITNLKQATDDQGNKLYVGPDGQITTQAPESMQNWYPLYLTEGQLTFDTIGKLISPKEGVIYSPFDPQNGSDLLRLNIDYGKYSTQFSSPFSVLSLSQDGYPSGSLNGLDIDAGGTIRANYTNGQTVALGKVMIANFANPNGLKQIGNANYVATSTSGQVVLGQAGADGFGNIKAGALERSNVDITEELVNLITAQRNFQANAKAIETTTQLSQTIIQIRG